MNKCINCKHLKLLKDSYNGRFGYCSDDNSFYYCNKMNSTDGDPDAPTLAYASDAEGYSAKLIVLNPRYFGCNMFKSKNSKFIHDPKPVNPNDL